MVNKFFTHTDKVVDHTMARGSDINNIAHSIERGFDKLPTDIELKEGRVTYSTDTGTANAYIVALPHIITAYTEGLRINFKALNANTGSSTINVDGVGAVTIKAQSGANLSAGDIVSGINEVTYNGTDFTLTSMSGSVVSGATTQVRYAMEWGTNAENSLISTAAGGDGSTDYSALHHANKASASSTASGTAQTGAETAQTNATTQAGIATTKAIEAAGSAATALAATVGKYDTKIAISSVDSPYTVASMTVDTLLNVNTTGGNVIVNLPTSSGELDNRLLGINKIGAVNTVTINPNGTDTIGGAASFTQYDDTEWADLYLDKAGADWLLGNLSYTNAGPGLKKLGSTISIDPTTTPQITTDQSWTGSQRATFVAANTGAYDMNAGQNFTTITTGPTVLSFTNITNGQSGLIDFNNTLAGPVTVAGAYITGSGTLLTTISAAGVYTLGYYSPDGVNVRITNSGLQGVPA